MEKQFGMIEHEKCSGDVNATSRLLKIEMNNQSLLLNLPSEITIDILSRLPVQTIIVCKKVCRTWLKLLSSDEFVKYHLSRSKCCLVTRLKPVAGTTCRLVEIDSVLDQNPVFEFDLGSINSYHNDKIVVEASYDGLLCVHDCNGEVDILYICNPLTRECVQLPFLRGHRRSPNTACYGIGISSSSGQYKVVRVFYKPAHSKGRSSCDSRLRNLKVECMVYTIGTGSWRSIATGIPYEYLKSRPSAVVVNGNLHWLVYDANNITLVSCLNLETELFNSFSLPSAKNYSFNPALTNLRESLCFCEHLSWDKMVIWMMKDYGVTKSWTKEYVINGFPGLSREIGATTHPLKAFNNGDVLLFFNLHFMFYYCNKTKTVREVEVPGLDSNGWFDVYPYTPSFLSLTSFGIKSVRMSNAGAAGRPLLI